MDHLELRESIMAATRAPAIYFYRGAIEYLYWLCFRTGANIRIWFSNTTVALFPTQINKNPKPPRMIFSSWVESRILYSSADEVWSYEKLYHISQSCRFSLSHVFESLFWTPRLFTHYGTEESGSTTLNPSTRPVILTGIALNSIRDTCHEPAASTSRIGFMDSYWEEKNWSL